MIKNKFDQSPHSFKFYTLLCILFIVVQIECILFVTKQISLFDLTITASGVTFPINILILGIITNCYGFQFARQLIWLNNFIIFQFILYSYFFNLIPIPKSMYLNQPDLVLSYNTLVPVYIKSAISGLIAENVANFFFVWFINRSKIIEKGKNIGWRILKYSFISNLIMLSISYLSIFIKYPILHIIKLIVSTLLIKMFIEIIFIKVAVVFANKLRKLEGVEIFDYSKFNPFSFLIKYEYINIKKE